MTGDVKAYLPEIESVTIYFLKDIASSERKFLKSDKIKHLTVPHFEGLTVDDFLAYADSNPRCALYFPPEKEIPKLPRQWIINVIYTLMGQNFSDWVSLRCVERNDKIKDKKQLNIKLDPEIAQAFRNSQTVSGKSHEL